VNFNYCRKLKLQSDTQHAALWRRLKKIKSLLKKGRKALLLYLDALMQKNVAAGRLSWCSCYSENIPQIKKSIPKAKEAASIFASFLSNGLMFSNMEKNIPLCLIAFFTPIMATPNAIYDNVQTVQEVFQGHKPSKGKLEEGNINRSLKRYRTISLFCVHSKKSPERLNIYDKKTDKISSKCKRRRIPGTVPRFCSLIV